MTFKIEALRDAIRIDRSDLDTELVQQPVYFEAVGREYARAVSIRDGRKDGLKELAAKLRVSIKDKSLEEGHKLTEADATARVEMHPKYKTARSEYLDACREADEWAALKDAFHQRAFILRDLAQLTISTYLQSDSSADYELNKRKIDQKRKEGRARARL